MPLLSLCYRAKRRLLIGARDTKGDLQFALEIILCILEQASPASRVAFALTCREWWNGLRNHTAKSGFLDLPTRRDREEFLQLLEKDVGGLYFCHDCVQLHPWSRRWIIGRNLRNDSRACANETRHAVQLSFHGMLLFHHARLLMNRQLYGWSHGREMMDLDRKRSIGGTPRGVRAKRTLVGRVLDGELFVKTTLNISHVKGKEQKLRRFIDSWHLPLCLHVRGGPTSRSGKVIPEIGKGTLAVPFVACENAAGACPWCFMDYTVTIAKDDGKKGWTIDIDVYRLLGSCRSPFDWHWRVAGEIEELQWNEPRSLFHPPGYVRDRWNEGNGLKTPGLKRGSFVAAVGGPSAHIPAPRRCPWGTKHPASHDCATYGLED